MRNLFALVLVLVLAAALTFCAAAHAVVHEFKGFAVHGFSVDVPPGWYVTQDTEGNKFDFNSPHGSITVAKTGGSESVTFLYASSEGLSAPTFATMVAGLVDGSTPVQNVYGGYEFTYTAGGEQINVETRHVSHLGIVMESKSGFEDILSILETLN